jgi:hypothetical protein
MPASYPSSLPSFTTKVDNVDSVVAAHPNDLQAEVLAVQSTVGTSPVISVLNASTRISSATSFNSSPISTTFSTVKERIANVERGLMGVGYVPAIDGGSVKTISASGSTVTDTFSSIPGGYRKLVLELEITAFSTGGAVTVTLNGVTSNYSVSRLVYTASTEDSEVQPSTSASGLSLGNATALGNIYVVEIPNYATNRAYKVFRALGPTLSLTGSVATGTVTSLTVAVAGTQTIQATLYVVK